MKKNQKMLIGFLILFYLLNIFNTFFITTEILNRYITVFNHNFWGEVNAFIGNFAALSLVLFIGFMFIKKTNSRLLYMIIITGALNIGIFASGIFTKYYQTVFSITEMSLFKNPAQELAFSIFIEAFKELFLYFRIIVFTPVITLTIYYFIIKKHYKNNQLDFKALTKVFNTKLINGVLIAGSLILSFFTLSNYNISMKSRWPIFAERSLYGVQKAGLYNYYLGQAFGFNFEEDNIIEVDVRTYQTYNRNIEEYTNLFGEKFSNQLYKKDAAIDFDLNPHIDEEVLNGIFKDKNLVLFHLESLNHFLFREDGPYLDESYYKTLKEILKESYVLENFYTNVGLGNSSDAEFSVVTGVYPHGHTTVYWNYEETKYVFDALPKLFNDRYSVSFHGEYGMFYNREKVHEEMLGFDDYFYFDRKEEYFPGTKNGFHQFPDHVNTNLPNEVWLTENDLLQWLDILYDKTANNQGQKGFYYPILMQPHTPFLYNPTKEEDLRFTQADINASAAAIRYLNYETYLEDFFKKFIEITHNQKDTIYIFYSDHGSGISQKDYEAIMGIETTSENAEENLKKYRQEMIKTIAFIYAPDDNDTSLGVKKGLLKGVQPRVRSQVDIYRTIVELFDLKTDNYYFGTNLLSKEHTFAIDTRNFNIVTDDYFIMGKKMAWKNKIEKSILRLNNTPMIEPVDVFDYVSRFKKKMDQALSENAYQYLKNN